MQNTKDTFNQILSKYISTRFVNEAILNRLENSTNIKNVVNELASRMQKTPKTIYKDRNSLKVLKMSTFLQYWYTTLELLHENKIDENPLPTLDEVLAIYKPYIDLLNNVNDADLNKDFEKFVESNKHILHQIITYLNNMNISSKTKLNKNEIQVLNKIIESNPMKQYIFNLKLERMQAK